MEVGTEQWGLWWRWYGPGSRGGGPWGHSEPLSRGQARRHEQIHALCTPCPGTGRTWRWASREGGHRAKAEWPGVHIVHPAGLPPPLWLFHQARLSRGPLVLAGASLRGGPWALSLSVPGPGHPGPTWRLDPEAKEPSLRPSLGGTGSRGSLVCALDGPGQMGSRHVLWGDGLASLARGLVGCVLPWWAGHRAEHLPSWLTTLEAAWERGLALPAPTQQGSGYTVASGGATGH